MSGSDLEVAVTAQHRLPLPGMGPQSCQSHFVRYQGSQQNVEGSWTSASSPTALSKGFAADFIRIEIMEAPAEWAVPTRVERYIKPPFKIRVVVGHRMSVAIPMRIKACLLTELDVKELQTWDPIPVMQDAQSVAKQVYTSLKGESEKCECIQAQYVPSSSSLSRTAKESSSCNSMQDVARPNLAQSARKPPGIHSIAEDAGQSRTCASNPLLPRNSASLDPGDRYQSPGTSDESVDSLAHGHMQRGSEGKGALASSPGLQPYPPTQQQAITVCEIPFPDLRFAKPSRMHPVYIAFCSTLPYCEDTLFSLFTVPTVVTCAEQGAAALKRLGRPQDLMSQATALRSSPTTHHTSSSAELADNTKPPLCTSSEGGGSQLAHQRRSSSSGSGARGAPHPHAPHSAHASVLDSASPMDAQGFGSTIGIGGSAAAHTPMGAHIPPHMHVFSGPHSAPTLAPGAPPTPPFPTNSAALPPPLHHNMPPYMQFQAAQQLHQTQQHAQQQHAQAQHAQAQHAQAQHAQAQHARAQMASQGGLSGGGGAWPMACGTTTAPPSTPFLGPALCPPSTHESGSSASMGHTNVPANWQGGSGYQGPAQPNANQDQVQTAIWQQGSTCSKQSSGSAAVSAALSAAVASVQGPPQPLQPPHPQHTHQTLGVWGAQGSRSDEGSRTMQDVRQHAYPASAPLPMLPPSASVAAPMSQTLLPNTHVLGTHYEPTPAGLAAWLEEEYQSTGLTRKLTQADIQTLVLRSGLQQSYSDPMQQHQHMAQIMAHVRAIFGILKQISSLWNQTNPVVVIAGFEVGRDDAARVLVRQPVGTFVCRISLSGFGGLALAVKALPDHPQAGPDGIVHVLMTPHDLSMRRADTVVRDLPGATHLLDLYTCKRVDKRKIFATHYTHLKKLEHLQSGTEHSVPGMASSRSAGSLQWLPHLNRHQTSGEGSTLADDPVTQAEREAAMEYPLVDLPVQAVLGSNAVELPASTLPLFVDTPPAAAAAPIAASFDTPMGPSSSAQSGGSHAALTPAQRPASALPAMVPTSYPSLTLDILDQSACVAMLNDSQDTQPRASLPPPVPVAASPIPAAAALGGCDEDVPMPILDKEEQSMVDMLIDG